MRSAEFIAVVVDVVEIPDVEGFFESNQRGA
jgi:hypothetical protein